MRPILISTGLLLLLTSCGQEPARRDAPATGGASLEQAALKAGAIHNGSTVDPAGLFQVDHDGGADSLCLRHASEGFRFDLKVAFGDRQSCTGRGMAKRAGETLVLDFSRRGTIGGCTVVAEYDGDRIVFPGVVDRGCDKLCTGRGSLEGVGFVRSDGKCG